MENYQCYTFPLNMHYNGHFIFHRNIAVLLEEVNTNAV